MASLEDLEDLERDHQEKRKEEDDKKKADGDDTKMDVDEEDKKNDDEIDADVLNSSTPDIVTRRRLLENELRIMRQEYQRLTHEKSSMRDKIKDNLEKIENNRSVLATSGASPHSYTVADTPPDSSHIS